MIEYSPLGQQAKRRRSGKRHRPQNRGRLGPAQLPYQVTGKKRKTNFTPFFGTSSQAPESRQADLSPPGPGQALPRRRTRTRRTPRRRKLQQVRHSLPKSLH